MAGSEHRVLRVSNHSRGAMCAHTCASGLSRISPRGGLQGLGTKPVRLDGEGGLSQELGDLGDNGLVVVQVDGPERHELVSRI